MENTIDKAKLLEELKSEEETETYLIWLYQTLIDLGVENCFSDDKKDFFKDSIKKLKNESESHKIMIKTVLSKYDN